MYESASKPTFPLSANGERNTNAHQRKREKAVILSRNPVRFNKKIILGATTDVGRTKGVLICSPGAFNITFAHKSRDAGGTLLYSEQKTSRLKDSISR